MRELTFIETGYLCALLCLSLVLPILMSFLGPVKPSTKQSSMKIVWLNQAIGTVCAIIVLSSAALAPYATLLALVTCAASSIALLQHTSALPISLSSKP